jgi:hypothetical protein
LCGGIAHGEKGGDDLVMQQTGRLLHFYDVRARPAGELELVHSSMTSSPMKGSQDVKNSDNFLRGL